MLRTPTRTKTSSFGGSQVDFQFPPSAMAIQDKSSDSFSTSNHHLLNSELLKRDNMSNIFSDSSADNSNGIDSGSYSFANISDNTTTRNRAHNGPKLSQASSWGSSASVSHQKYPTTLAPRPNSCALDNLDPGFPSIRKSDTAAFLHRKRSHDIQGHQSISTVACTIPTAENISFQITFESSPSKESLLTVGKPARVEQSQLSNRKESFKPARAPSRKKSITSYRSPSKLKRSDAIRCKGGLLQFFTQLGWHAKTRVRRWRLAIRKKLFTYKAKRSAKKNQKQTSSHLKRAKNGYVSNIERSISSNSININSRVTRNASKRSTEKITRAQTPSQTTLSQTQSPSKTTRNSLRRSPSSIKRAASTLTRTSTFANATIGGDKRDSNEPNSKTRLVRSDRSMSLNSIVRQPSIVVSNKVIPLSKLNGEINDFSIKEEDEDEYVIDTDYMKRSDDNLSSSSDQSSGVNDEDYQDTSEQPYDQEALELSHEKVTVALDAWNHYLRAVVAQRISTRLQIRKFQHSGTEAECQKLIDALISDYDDNSSSRYDSDLETELTPMSSINTTNDGVASRVVSDVASKTNESILSFKPLSTVFHGNVKRSLTLPIGLRV
ncbi:LAME_0F12266g1_1 [Lachancea meyersii CBS 8951]|uniref:LAME_0F12266g1_1 n=1 Tax=Lachancea meyersii CBS 8951 TaxID=1266667 RepID=A0A1G4JWM5_9SACH|nr:LAME_0F12266g1_1 [Lachancea meyersii CBS 8951]